MASRPFASVAVALDAGSDREELLQVRTQHKHATIHDSNNHHPKKRHFFSPFQLCVSFKMFLFGSDVNLKIEGKELIEQGRQQADA